MRKVVLDMITKLTKSKVTTIDRVAEFLGHNSSQFNNRLYQVNGQRFTESELLAIQSEYNVTDYTDAICHATGGVFVKFADKDELDQFEMFKLQIAEQSSKAEFDKFYAEAIADDTLTKDEIIKLHELHAKVYKARSAKIEASIKLFSK